MIGFGGSREVLMSSIKLHSIGFIVFREKSPLPARFFAFPETDRDKKCGWVVYPSIPAVLLGQSRTPKKSFVFEKV